MWGPHFLGLLFASVRRYTFKCQVCQYLQAAPWTALWWSAARHLCSTCSGRGQHPAAAHLSAAGWGRGCGCSWAYPCRWSSEPPGLLQSSYTHQWCSRTGCRAPSSPESPRGRSCHAGRHRRVSCCCAALLPTWCLPGSSLWSQNYCLFLLLLLLLGVHLQTGNWVREQDLFVGNESKQGA